MAEITLRLTENDEFFFAALLIQREAKADNIARKAEYWERAGKWQKIVQLQQGKSLLYSVQLTLGKADTSWQVFFC